MRVSIIVADMLGAVALGRKSLALKKNMQEAASGAAMDEKPEEPSQECFDWDSFYAKSGTDCDDIWRAWDDWCVDYTVDGCRRVNDAFYEHMAANAKRPDDVGCMDWESYYKMSDTECDTVW